MGAASFGARSDFDLRPENGILEWSAMPVRGPLQGQAKQAMNIFRC
jgi:hypothetical protein